jgi:hypothetical protein
MDAVETQHEICRRHGAAYVSTAPDEKLGVALATLDGRLPLNALRHPPAEGTCGWYVWAGEPFPTADDAFAPLHVAHVPDHCPELAPYLGLAPGWRVLLAPGYVDVWYDATLLHV